jgi:hypothetical protein
MSKERRRELEKADTWDFERPEVREPVKASRVVVSVAFKRDDFTRVSEYAKHTGRRTSEFIREAAIDKAAGSGTILSVDIGGSISQWWTEQMPSYTQNPGSFRVDPEPVTTAC